MLSEKYAKVIRSLIHKKYRLEYNLFVAEGRKSVLDMLDSGFQGVDKIFLVEEEWNDHSSKWIPWKDKIQVISTREMNKISNLDSPPTAVLTGQIPPPVEFMDLNFEQGLHLYLDQIQDTGNLGTILRTAEWFGIQSIGLSEGCADIVHPKVIQASMGSFCRIKYWLGDLATKEINSNTAVLGAELNGKDLYQDQLPAQGMLVIGNEGKGISSPISAKLTKSIKIPAYSDKTESLNAAIATAIILAEWRRQINQK